MEIITLLRIRLQILKNKVLGLGQESRLKTGFILTFIVLYGIGSFWFFYEIFDYINRVMGFGFFLIDRLFYLFFMTLFFMLIISQLIIVYSSFYRNKEIEYLFSLPVAKKSIYVIKYFETTVLSSWTFVFLAIPLFLAYGVQRSLGIGFYVSGMFLSIPFIFLATSIGTIITILIVRFYPGRFNRLIITFGAVITVFLYFYYKGAKGDISWNSADVGLVINRLLSHTRVSLFPFLPSFWIGRGILSYANADWQSVLFYFLMLLSTSLFMMWVCFKVGKSLYFDSWQGILCGQKKKIYLPGKHFLFLRRGTLRGIMNKDLKLFIRDPVQWSQFAIFFGMIAVYFFNLRSLQYDIKSIYWKNLISFLNIGTISLTLGMLSTRFIFPQVSLESRRMWILGLAPVSLGKIMLVKYIISTAICLIITIPLIIGSNILLRVPAYIVPISIGTVFLVSVTLPAMALGIGAIYPNFKEDDMAKIVSGFGGTLTLVMSLTYIIFVLAVEAIPVHLYFIKNMISAGTFTVWMSLSTIIIVLVSMFVSLFPLIYGYKKLRYAEI